jgi:GNAT superfamily N-acetyltransferase
MTPDEFLVREVEGLPDGIEALVEASVSEGFRFLDRLVTDWSSGANRFSAEGECFAEARFRDRVVAVGGLNVDPYAESISAGRLRRFYVHPDYRRRGVGRALVEYLVARGRSSFDCIRLRTDRVDAMRFYEKLGFRVAPTDADATHELLLTSSHVA